MQDFYSTALSSENLKYYESKSILKAHWRKHLTGHRLKPFARSLTRKILTLMGTSNGIYATKRLVHAPARKIPVGARPFNATLHLPFFPEGGVSLLLLFPPVWRLPLVQREILPFHDACGSFICPNGTTICTYGSTKPESAATSQNKPTVSSIIRWL